MQRYHLGLMTPDEEVAFEHAVVKSPELSDELQQTGDALTSMYENVTKVMPAPRKPLKNIILEK